MSGSRAQSMTRARSPSGMGSARSSLFGRNSPTASGAEEGGKYEELNQKYQQLLAEHGSLKAETSESQQSKDKLLEEQTERVQQAEQLLERQMTETVEFVVHRETYVRHGIL
eukprot:gene23373-35809_t